jgi:DNA-binding PadR family transcriptional regulator
MANEKKMDCVILGLLSHEDLTGYEIKKRMDTALKLFWGASFGSIYPTLKDLVEKGLATKSEAKEGGRDKVIYTITEQGRQHLKNWLASAVDKDEMRYETLLRLFFGDEVGAKTTLKHIENFEEKIKNEIPFLENSIKTLENLDDQKGAHLYYRLTALFGVKVFNAYLEWCDEAKNVLKGEG